MPESYRSFSVNFNFDLHTPEKNIIFGDTKGMMKFNYKSNELAQLYKFENQIGRQPDYVVFDEFQDTAIIASTDDVLWVNVTKKIEIDVDEKFQLGDDL